MNAYNPLDSMKRLESAGLPRQHAEAIAAEIGDGTSDLVTKAYLDEKLDSWGNRLILRVGAMTLGIVGLASTILGLLIALQ